MLMVPAPDAFCKTGRSILLYGVYQSGSDGSFGLDFSEEGSFCVAGKNHPGIRKFFCLLLSCDCQKLQYDSSGSVLARNALS